MSGEEFNKLEEIVNQGIFIESPRPPDTYYKGWYPVRRSSIPIKKKEPSFTMTSKTMGFKGHRVCCTICDKPTSDSSQGQCEFQDEAESVCGVKRNNVEVENTHWRFHDPHAWTEKPKIVESEAMHSSNWFREQINLELQNKNLQKAEQKAKCYKALKRLKEQELLEVTKAAQKKLQEQQKKCSFNNPIVSAIPPLPEPPVVHVGAIKQEPTISPFGSRTNYETEMKPSSSSNIPSQNV